MKIIKGNIFESEMKTLVDPCNRKGAMGKGLSLLYSQKFPDYAREFKRLAVDGKILPGLAFLWNGDEHNILSLPTKNCWKNPSRISYIVRGLLEIKEFQDNLGSIAIPALGCGCGGLEWSTIGPIICEFAHFLHIDTEIYVPLDLPNEEVTKLEKYYNKGEITCHCQ